MTIRAVIFDFGGVLVRTEDYSGRRKWEAQLSMLEGALEQAVFDSEVAGRCSAGELPESELWRYVGETYGLTPEQLLEFQRDFWGGDRLDARLLEFVRSLRPRYKTAILSNAWSGARQTFSERFGVIDAVDDVIISAEEGVVKPDPRIYQIAAARLGVRTDEAIFVDDFLANVIGAREAGMFAVHFKTTEQAIAEVRALLAPGGRAD